MRATFRSRYTACGTSPWTVTRSTAPTSPPPDTDDKSDFNLYTFHYNYFLQETALTCVSSNQNTEDLKLLDGDPRVRREALQHGHQELEAARPVDDQQHHAQQVEDLHEHSHGLQQLEYIMEELLQICDGWLTLAIEFWADWVCLPVSLLSRLVLLFLLLVI